MFPYSGCNPCSVTARGVPASQKLIPHAGEGNKRGAGVYATAGELDSPALPTEPIAGLQQRDPVPGAPEQGGGGETSDPASYHDHPAHG